MNSQTAFHIAVEPYDKLRGFISSFLKDGIPLGKAAVLTAVALETFTGKGRLQELAKGAKELEKTFGAIHKMADPAKEKYFYLTYPICLVQKVSFCAQMLLFSNDCNLTPEAVKQGIAYVGATTARVASDLFGEYGVYVAEMTTKKVSDFSLIIVFVDLSITSVWGYINGNEFSLIGGIPAACKLTLIASCYLFALSDRVRLILSLAAAYFDVVVAYHKALTEADKVASAIDADKKKINDLETQLNAKPQALPPAAPQPDEIAMADLRKALQSAEEKATGFETRVKGLQVELDGLRESNPNDRSLDLLENEHLARLQAQVEAIPGYLGELKARKKLIKQMKADLDALKLEKATLTQDLEKASEEAKTAAYKQSVIDSKLEEIADLKAAIEKLKTEMQAVNKAAEDAKTEANTAAEKVTKKQSRITERETRIRELEASIERLREEKEEAQRTANGAAENATQSQTTLSEKETKIQELNGTIAQLQSEKAALESKLDEALKEAAKASELNTEYESILNKKTTVIESLNNQIKNLEKEVAEANAIAEKAKKEAKESAEFADLAQKRLATMQQRIDELTEDAKDNAVLGNGKEKDPATSEDNAYVLPEVVVPPTPSSNTYNLKMLGDDFQLVNDQLRMAATPSNEKTSFDLVGPQNSIDALGRMVNSKFGEGRVGNRKVMGMLRHAKPVDRPDMSTTTSIKNSPGKNAMKEFMGDVASTHLNLPKESE